MSLIKLTAKGLYCEKAGVYIDPWRKVDKALVTHAHSDHARRGSRAYLSHKDSVNILKYRLGKNISIQGIPFEKPMDINGVEITFFPAGHIIGSAQIRLRDKHECWVVSGDYNLSKDDLVEEFVPVTCDYFVTESTFGLPVFQWENPNGVIDDINKWWQSNQENNRPSIINAYSLGKAQRLIQNLDHSIGPIYTHPTIESINAIVRNDGKPLKPSQQLGDQSSTELNRSLIISPSSALNTEWSKNITNPSMAFASGWMAVKSTRRTAISTKGFVLSDHADWHGLNEAVQLTQAKKVFVTHGYSTVFSKWLNAQGIDAEVLETKFEGEKQEDIA